MKIHPTFQTPDEMEMVRELGGLHVIGSERHEARRIDNQLRGRAARQGDPGSSRFFVSLEDDLMRMFGGERTETMMRAFNIDSSSRLKARCSGGWLTRRRNGWKATTLTSANICWNTMMSSIPSANAYMRNVTESLSRGHGRGRFGNAAQ